MDSREKRYENTLCSLGIARDISRQHILWWTMILVRRLLLCAILLAPYALVAQSPVEQACAAFDQAIERMDLRTAKATLTGLQSPASNAYDVLYRMARLHVLLGNDERNEQQQLALYEKALDYGNRAVAANAKGMGGYVYRAAANGKIALFKGIFSVADVVARVRDDASQAIRLNNDTPKMLAAAHYILGRAHLNLAKKPKLFRSPLGLGWGSIDEAFRNLKRARELRPGFIMFELEYANCLAEMDDDNGAIAHARTIAGMRNQEPGDPQRKQDALELIKDLE